MKYDELHNEILLLYFAAVDRGGIQTYITKQTALSPSRRHDEDPQTLLWAEA